MKRSVFSAIVVALSFGGVSVKQPLPCQHSTPHQTMLQQLLARFHRLAAN